MSAEIPVSEQEQDWAIKTAVTALRNEILALAVCYFHSDSSGQDLLEKILKKKIEALKIAEGVE